AGVYPVATALSAAESSGPATPAHRSGPRYVVPAAPVHWPAAPAPDAARHPDRAAPVAAECLIIAATARFLRGRQRPAATVFADFSSRVPTPATAPKPPARCTTSAVAVSARAGPAPDNA